MEFGGSIGKAGVREDSLEARLDFFGIDKAVRDTLQRMAPAIAAAMPEALNTFYAKVQDTPEVARFFAQSGAIEKAKKLQGTHWGRITSGEFGSDYAEAVRRIGAVHARIGLEPRWYIGGYARIVTYLVRQIIDDGKGSLLGRGRGNTAADVNALIRAALLDMDLAISIYLENLEADRQRAEAERKTSLHMIAQALERIAEGDLTARLDGETLKAAPELGEAFARAVGGLSEIVANVRETGSALKNSSAELAQASDDLARRTEQQAASLEQTAATASELARTVKAAAQDAQKVEATVRQAESGARDSNEVIAKTRQAMSQIQTSAGEMEQIISVIDEIAFQTNLLALNAGVEAARAGEAGKGFAVVASEVRALAQRSSEAARNIKQLIERSNQHVAEGGELVVQTETEIARILEAFKTISGLVSGMAAATREQAQGINELDSVVTNLDQMTQQNAAMVEETAATVVSMDQQASELGRLVGRFVIEGDRVIRLR